MSRKTCAPAAPRVVPGTAPLLSLLCLLVIGCSDQTPPSAPIGTAETPLFADVDLAAILDCARSEGITLLQAHRAGDRPGAAENSLTAISASLADGAVFLEIDVARTADDVLVLMHDDTLDRTTTGTGDLGAVTYAQVEGLTLVDSEGRNTREPVPTLAEALAALDGRGFAQIDRKAPTTFDEIAGALEAAGATHRSIVITYSMEDAIALHERLPEVMISTGIDSLADVAALEDSGVDLTRITAWLGLGTGNPALDRELSALGIETTFGDFRAEARGAANYRLMAANGAEVISVDDVPAAAAALEAPAAVLDLLETCPGARLQTPR